MLRDGAGGGGDRLIQSIDHCGLTIDESLDGMASDVGHPVGPAVTRPSDRRRHLRRAAGLFVNGHSAIVILQSSFPVILIVVVALLSLELHIAGARSLKDKRMVLRGVKDRLRAFNVAVAELEHQDLWQRAGLGVVTVAGSEALAERELRNVVDAIDAAEPGIVSRSEVEFLT